MKWLAVLMLVANLCLFGWYFNQQLGSELTRSSDRQATAAALDEGIPRLTLLGESRSASPEVHDQEPQASAEQASAVGGSSSELPQQAGAASHSETQAGQSLKQVHVCYRIGPLATAEASDELHQWLQQQALAVQARQQEQRISTRFWVFLEPDEDPEQTRQTLEELGRKGFKDYLLIKQGTMKNAISLGVFSAQESVNRRLAEMQREGYTPVVVPRHKTRQEYWLDFAVDEDFNLLELPFAKAPTPIQCEGFDHSFASQ